MRVIDKYKGLVTCEILTRGKGILSSNGSPGSRNCFALHELHNPRQRSKGEEIVSSHETRFARVNVVGHRICKRTKSASVLKSEYLSWYHIPTHTHTHSHRHTSRHSHTHTHTYIDTDTYTQSYKNIVTPRHTHSDIQTHTPTDTHKTDIQR